MINSVNNYKNSEIHADEIDVSTKHFNLNIYLSKALISDDTFRPICQVS